MYDLIIVGGGPAGLTAATYAIRKRLNVLVVSQDLGGKINYDLEVPGVQISPLIRGVDIVEQFWQELETMNFAHRLERVKAVTKHNDIFTLETAVNSTLQCRSLIWATGCRLCLLNIPGEREFMGKGLSYSAASYASLMSGKKTVVIGDASLALRSVAELALVSDMVHLIIPIPTYAAMESPLLKRLVESGKVAVWEGYRVQAITGERYANCVVLLQHDGKQIHIRADAIFMELGITPNSEPVRELIEVNEEGFVMVDAFNQTSCAGLFAAGDVTNSFGEQVLIAVGDGAKAALSAYNYLLPML